MCVPPLIQWVCRACFICKHYYVTEVKFGNESISLHALNINLFRFNNYLQMKIIQPIEFLVAFDI